MTQQAMVTGEVKFRIGDGPLCTVPKGPIEIEVTPMDVTVSWDAEDTHQNASIPRAEFARFLSEKSIHYV